MGGGVGIPEADGGVGGGCSVELGFVGFFDGGLHVFGGVGDLDLILEHVAVGRDLGFVVVVPEFGADEGLAAVEEGFVDSDDEGGGGVVVVGGPAMGDCGVGGDVGGAVDAEGFLGAGDEEEKADGGVGEDVGQGVETVVAAPVGEGEGRVIEDVDEAGSIAARGDVGPVGAVSGEGAEGAFFNEGAAVFVEFGLGFEAGAFEDGRVEGAEFVEGCDEAGRHVY